MTKSGEISGAQSNISSCLDSVLAGFESISGKNKWQGDSNDQLKAKVQNFISEAQGIIDSKMSVLAKFAQKYEDFEQMSKQTQPIRDTRCQHCKTHNPSSPSSDGCHFTIPVYDEDGNIIEWLNNGSCGPWQSAKNQVESNVSTMTYWLNDAQSIKGSFPSTAVSEGEGTDASSFSSNAGESCGTCSNCG